ncbi:MAG TPA: hypothetical protein ENF73_04885 [Proteobacteria bacterium]|nr:hypothetical protein [Pseudomonadota bacterium]
MNVFCILIPFLVMAAVFVQLSVIDVILPAAAAESPEAQGEQEQPQESTPTLNLTLAITKEGFIIAGYGGVLDVGGTCGQVRTQQGTEAEGENARATYIIPKKPDGSWDFECLRKNLVRVKDAYPDQYGIIILPEPDIKYQTIIDVIDVAREERFVDADGNMNRRVLFPSPILAGGVLR